MSTASQTAPTQTAINQATWGRVARGALLDLEVAPREGSIGFAGEGDDKSFTSVTPSHLIVPWVAFEMHFMGRGGARRMTSDC